MRFDTAVLITVILAVILIGCITIYGYGIAERESRTAVKVPAANRGVFSEVYIILDATGTMNDADVASAKNIVKNRIIGTLGVNDRAVCYALSGEFDENKSVVFGKEYEDQLPQLDDAGAREILGLYRAGDGSGLPPTCSAAGCEMIEGLRSKQDQIKDVRKQWTSRVDAMGRPKVDGSDYVAALEGIKKRLGGPAAARTQDTGQVREKWLILVGDLIQESKRPHPDITSNEVFRSVDHIVLIHPSNSERDSQAIEKFWADYFGGIKTTRYTFGAVQGEAHLIKPNPTESLEVIRAPSFDAILRPYLMADLVIILVVTLCSGFYFVSRKLAKRRARRTHRGRPRADSQQVAAVHAAATTPPVPSAASHE